MRNTLLACTVMAASVAACHKSPPETGAAPTTSAAADTAMGAVTSKAPTAAADSAAAAAKAPGAAAGNLNEMLGSNIPVSADQAKAGTGAVLSYAQGKLPPGDYQKVAAAVPGAADDIQAAKDAGAVTGPITDKSGLDTALGKLGISPEVAAQFVPAVTNYIGKVGGPEVGNLVKGLF